MVFCLQLRDRFNFKLFCSFNIQAGKLHLAGTDARLQTGIEKKSGDPEARTRMDTQYKPFGQSKFRPWLRSVGPVTNGY